MPPFTLPRSEVHRLELEGGPLELLVALPDVPAPEGGYPALFVLDGEQHFPVAAQIVRRGFKGDGALVVFGLAYPQGESRRDLDYTPTAAYTHVANDKNEHGGGAEAFLHALAEKVLPYATEHFELASSKLTLFGHSYGGLLVLHTLLTRPGLFWGHVASSPSLWYDDGELKARLLALKENPLPNGWLRHTVGADEQDMSGPDLRLPEAEQRGRREHLRRRNMVDHSGEVAAHLSGLMANYQFYAYPGFGHVSVTPSALSGGVEATNAALHQQRMR